MTPGGTRLALSAFVLLSSGLLANLFMLQAPGRGTPWSPITQTGSTDRTEPAPAVAWSHQLAGNGGDPAKAAPLAGDSAELTRAVQRELNARGYDTGVVDGVAGLVTRAAIIAYEGDHGLPLTGEPREALLENILLGSGARTSDTAARGEEPGPRAQSVIRAVQRALQKLGYYSGAIDGRLSPETARSIRQFEAKLGMTETGRISGPLLARLARVAGQSVLAESP